MAAARLLLSAALLLLPCIFSLFGSGPPAAVEDDLSHDFMPEMFSLQFLYTAIIIIMTLCAFRRNRLLHHHHHSAPCVFFVGCGVVVVVSRAHHTLPPALFHAFIWTFLGFLGRVRRAALLLYILPLPMPSSSFTRHLSSLRGLSLITCFVKWCIYGREEAVQSASRVCSRQLNSEISILLRFTSPKKIIARFLRFLAGSY